MKVIRRNDLLQLIGLSRSSLYAMTKSGRFPKPIRLGQRAVGWREADVQAWLASRPAAGEPS